MDASQPLIQSAEISRRSSVGWHQQLLLYSLIFVAVMLIHAPLLRLPYFWDEAGYYMPSAYDLYLTGTLVPHTTPSNAHPPLVMAWLAIAWRLAGYSPLVTRIAMLSIAAFSLLGLYRLCSRVANQPVAWATTLLLAVYPPFFTQCSLGQVDLPAAGFTFWALLAYVEDRPKAQALWFTTASMAKETAVLVPLSLLAWELTAIILGSRWREFAIPPRRRKTIVPLLAPLIPLCAWYGYHYMRTGFLFGNPEFFRYNVSATLDFIRIPLAFGLRLWQLFGYFGLYLLTLAAALAMLRGAKNDTGGQRERIPLWTQGAFATVVFIYALFMSVVGGAVLARYMLPVVPLVILILVSTIWRRLKYWRLVVGAVGAAFIAGLFTNPPYGFSLEDNLAYRDYIVMHAETARFLALRYPHARVLTAWPAFDEVTRPWLGYVSRPLHGSRVDDFTEKQITDVAGAGGEFDVVYAFSTKYEPAHPLFESWAGWQRLKERYFGYHRDLPPEDIAQRLGAHVVFHKEIKGQWVAVIELRGDQPAPQSN